MRPTLTVLFLVIILLGSCMRTSNYDKLFSTADSLMDTRPDSALYILKGMGDSTSLSKRDRMRWMLLLAKAQNKAYVTMPDDSIFEEVVEYYDKNGSPNDRVQAHYLYGCISRDLGDAPRALERYMEAVTCADTTASDCDHATLMGVYGQMADLFYKQGLPEEEARALGLSGEHALKAHNVRNYIRCVELLVRPYYELHVPAFYLDLRDAHGLSELELRTALLECIGVKSGGISRVLGKSSQHVTNLKASVNMKMFGDGKAGQLRSNLKRRIDMLHKPSP